MRPRSFLVMLLLIGIACHQDDNLTETSVIDPGSPGKDDLWSYASRFFAEASSRKITLHRANLVIHFNDGPPGFFSTRSSASTAPPEVAITRNNWTAYDDVHKEIVMFSALGAALLGRQATDEKLPDCVHYKSLMVGANTAFTTYQSIDDEKRQYYVDELFNPHTPVPSWAGTPKTNFHPILTNVTDGWQFFQGGPQMGTRESDGSFHLQSKQQSSANRSVWALQIPSDGIPKSMIEVTLQIKTEKVTNGDAAVMLVGADNLALWTSTDLYHASNGYTLDGTRDWIPVSLKLNCYPDHGSPIIIKLSLAGKGDAWFKDVSFGYYD